MTEPKKKVLINVGQRTIETKSGLIHPTGKPVRIDADEADKLLVLFKGELVDAEAETRNLDSQATDPVTTKENPVVNAPKAKPQKTGKTETAEERTARQNAEEKAALDLAAEAKEKGMSVEDLTIMKKLEAEEAAKTGKTETAK